MNVVDNHFLTTDPTVIKIVKSVMANCDGKVFITTRLGLDARANGENVECFTATTDGKLSSVEQYTEAEWDVVLLRMMLANTPIAVVERENVLDARSQLYSLMNAGKTLPQAVSALLPE